MEKIFQKYLSRHRVWTPVNPSAEAADVRVVVPVYLEEDYLLNTLTSLDKAAFKCSCAVEVVLVFNYSEAAAAVVKAKQKHMLEAISIHPDCYPHLTVTLIEAFDLAKKHAGAGYARKIGMDYAVSRFVEVEQPRGLIISLDADCDVEESYFEVLSAVNKDNNISGGTIAFRHQKEGLNAVHLQAIDQYELHLRYYLQATLWTGHPYACHTVGSAFFVTAEAYVRAGGMTRKQAGEDFYFLQKLIPLGRFITVNNTCVYPSSRVSDRVIFGTGPALAQLLDGDDYQSYNLQAFIDLKAFFDLAPQLFKVTYDNYLTLLDSLSGRIRSFLLNSGFYDDVENINNNCASEQVFQKRFYELFDMFKVVKYLNYIHEHFLEKVPVYDAALDFLELIGEDAIALLEVPEVLRRYEELEGLGC